MGEQTRDDVRGGLLYVPVQAVHALRMAPGDALARAAALADICRLNALYMIARAGSGHIGSSFSSLDIVCLLLLDELGTGDLYFSSKGHDAPGLYAALIALGRLPEELLHGLRRLGGLPGHPDVATPGIVTNTGSLGMGISKAKGMIAAHRLRGQQRRVFVLVGDGELQEGQIWESLQGALANEMSELVVIVDHNRVQSDRLVRFTSDLGDLGGKLASFGWHVERCDGHDMHALSAALGRCATAGKPSFVIADTIKGRGVSFMEHHALSKPDDLYRFHSGAPSEAQYRAAADELCTRIAHRLDALDCPLEGRFVHVAPAAAAAAAAASAVAVTPESSASAGRPGVASRAEASADGKQRLIAAYGAALLEHARRDPKIVALDADLMVDMGLLEFSRELPERFVECGIAEMDMVSQAGGMALRGALPVCHSFAAFMTARANEQIYNNATERTRVVYVGGLAGLLPAGPGHSHQALRDIAALGAIPGLELIAPSDEQELRLALAYALQHARGSTYLRLCSLPWPLPFAPAAHSSLTRGRGRVVRAGSELTLTAYGPVMLSQAFLAAEALHERHGVSVQVLALPFLNHIDSDWLLSALGSCRYVFTLDDHALQGGQGELVFSQLLEAGSRVRGRRFGVHGLPACGTSDEVLRHHGLDAASLCQVVGDWL